MQTNHSAHKHDNLENIIITMMKMIAADTTTTRNTTMNITTTTMMMTAVDNDYGPGCACEADLLENIDKEVDVEQSKKM